MSSDVIDESDVSLSIIGHPFGGALCLSNALSFDYSSSDQAYRLKSVAISGNSGSPLIDNKTNTVVGLYFAGGWDKETIKVNGDVEHFGYAVPVQHILGHFNGAVVNPNGTAGYTESF